MAELSPTDFRKVINRMDGEELRQTMLYFKLGVIAFLKKKRARDPKAELFGRMTDKELSTLATYFFLGVATYYGTVDETARVLKLTGLELADLNGHTT